MKHYTEQDVEPSGAMPGAGKIDTENYREDCQHSPLAWQRRGLQETATGYGARLNTGYKINFCGRLYRVYCTCYSNSGTCWFKAKGRTIIVS